VSPVEKARLRLLLETFMSPAEQAPVVELIDSAISRTWTAGWEQGYHAAMASVRGELGAAVVQTLPSDDQVIAGHVRTAYVLAGGRA